MSKSTQSNFKSNALKAVSMGALLSATLGAGQAWGVTGSFPNESVNALLLGGNCLIPNLPLTYTGTIEDFRDGNNVPIDEFAVRVTDSQGNLVGSNDVYTVPVGDTRNNPSLWISTSAVFPVTFTLNERVGSVVGPAVASRSVAMTEMIGGCSFSNPNTAPVANAGPDQTSVASGSTVTLDGTGSSDADGDTLIYSWTQVSGTPVTLSDPTAASPTFTAPGTAETLVFQLIVNDGTEDSVADTVEVTTVASGLQIIDMTLNPAIPSTGYQPINSSQYACSANNTTGFRSFNVVGSEDDGGGKDYFDIEWYDTFGNLLSENIVTRNVAIAQFYANSDGTPRVSQLAVESFPFFYAYDGSPDAYIIYYDTDGPGGNRLDSGTRFDPTINVADDAGWRACWDQLRSTNTAPVANAGPDQTMAAVGSTVTLDGTGSSDADGDTLTYAWTQVSGPVVTLSDATAAMPTFTLPAGAVSTPIVFQLIVNDGTEDSAADQVSIQGVPANTAPVADAGADQTTLRPNDVVTLDGSGSTDADGDTLTYMWTQVSGPAVTLDDVTAVNPTFTIPLDAVTTPIVFELIVNDGTVDSAPDQVTFQAVNDAPVANAGPDQTDPRPNDVVTLDGTSSSDPDGDGLTYMWTQVSGPAVTLDDATSATPTFTIPLDAVATAIVFELVVNDGFVDSAPDQVMIMAQNESPIADAGLDQDDPRPNSVVTLDGSGSSDPDGDTLTYMWTQVSGPAVTLDDPTAVNPTFTIPVAAVTTPIVFQLVVNDGFVDSAPDTVTIMAQNEAPVAEAGIDQNNVIPGNSIGLDGTGSTDADGDPLTYMWTQVSGTPVTLDDATSATPTFEAPGGGGALVFQLVVNDGFVDSAPDMVTITVQDNVAVTTKAIGDFLTARNSLILSHQPDLQRRIDRLQGRGGKRGASSVNGIPVLGSSNLPVQMQVTGGNAQLSGSLSGLKNTDGNRKVSEPGTIDVWGEAYFTSFTIDQRSGDFGMYYLGADYLLSEDVLIGMLGQLDTIDYDDNFLVGVLDGEGWMVGPYVTARLSDNLYGDARISYGTSDNTIAPFGTYVDSFETSRYLMAGTLTGEFDLSETFTLRPEAGITYLSEDQDSYVDALGSTIPSQSSEQGQLHLAPRLHYNYMSDTGFNFRPFVEVEGIYSFGDGVSTVIGDDTRFRFEGGFDVFTGGGLRLSGSYFKDGIAADNYDAEGFRLTGGYTF